MIHSLNATDKDSLSRYLIFTIDYKNTKNLPFKIDKYFGGLEYILENTTNLPQLYKFNVIISDYQFEISVLFEIFIYKSQPIVNIDGLSLNYEIPKSNIVDSVITKVNLTGFGLGIIDQSLIYEIIYDDGSKKFNIERNTGVLKTSTNEFMVNDEYVVKILVQNSSVSVQIVYLIVNLYLKIVDDGLDMVQNKFYFNSIQHEAFALFKKQIRRVNSTIIHQKYFNLFQIDQQTNEIKCLACEYFNDQVYNLVVLLSSFDGQSRVVYVQLIKNESINNNKTKISS